MTTKPALRTVAPREETGAERAARMEREARLESLALVRDWLASTEAAQGLAQAVAGMQNLPPGVRHEAGIQATSLEAAVKRVEAILARG